MKTKKELREELREEFFKEFYRKEEDESMIGEMMDFFQDFLEKALQAKEEEVLERVVGTLYEKRKELLDLLSRFESEDVKRDKIKEEFIKSVKRLNSLKKGKKVKASDVSY